jgi:type IV pilus assembly protein PilM
MASPRFFTLNLGSQSVSVAEFRSDSKGRLTLKHFETRDLLPDPATDSSRVSQASLALGEISEALKLKNQPLLAALPSQSVFSRLIKLAFVEPGKLNQTVEFEAQQNIPYPLPEVVWDFKNLSPADSPEPEILLVAGKRDILEEWREAAKTASFITEQFELAPLAVYNAFRYNYGEPEGCSLLIDLGSRTTNLLFIEPGKFFLRSISSGGTTLTSAIAKEFSENFIAAENRKRSQGFVAQGSNHADHPDPEIAKLSKVIRNTLTRLHAEIARSISFYRSQQGGAAPNQIYLSGGGANLPLMSEFLAEKLGVPVENFNPLRCVKIGDGVNRDELHALAPILGEHVGLALRNRLTCPLQINLPPPSVERSKIQNQQILSVALAGAVICSPMLAWGFHLSHATSLCSGLVEKQRPQVESLTKLDKDIKAAQAQIQILLEKSKPLESLARDREYWTLLVNHIHSKLPPEKVWITSFDIPPKETAAKPSPGLRGRPQQATSAPEKKDPREKLVLRGLYLENPKGVALVEQFGKDLQKSDLYDVAPEQEWLRVNVVNPKEWAQEFVIPLYLKSAPAPSVNTPK